jgi:hypothetical protein
VRRPISVAACLVSLWLVRVSTPGPHFRLVRSDPGAAAHFDREIADCTAGTRAFAEVVNAIPAADPVSVMVGDTLRGVLFGGSSDVGSGAPLFLVDLRDLAVLPGVASVRQWPADSSWALTRCEVLVHELAETLAYRALWRARPAGETPEEAEALFGARKRRAHLAGLEAERAVAMEQRTRVDGAGAPYGRTRECFTEGAVHVVLGPHTETLVLSGSGPEPRVVYYPHQNLCASL